MKANLSRRAVALELATLPIASSFAALPTDDPIYAAMRAHDEAEAALSANARSEPSFGENAAHDAWDLASEVLCEAEAEAAWAILKVEPTTVAGVIAFLDYVPAFSRNGFNSWPEREATEDDDGGPNKWHGVKFEDDAMRFVSRQLKRLLA